MKLKTITKKTKELSDKVKHSIIDPLFLTDAYRERIDQEIEDYQNSPEAQYLNSPERYKINKNDLRSNIAKELYDQDEEKNG